MIRQAHIVVGVLGVLATQGCINNSGSAAGQNLTNLDQLAPASYNDSRAKLILGGISIETEAKVTKRGDSLLYEFLSHDIALDTERYALTNGKFLLIEASSETYHPPIELLRSPMVIGDNWEWKGKLTSGSVHREATAAIMTSSEDLALKQGQYDSLKCVVQLSFESGGIKPAEKTLAFWFVPQRGLVKREFGFAGGREPVDGR